MTDSADKGRPDVELTPVDFDPFAEQELLATVPSTEPQQEIWVSAQMGEGASCAFNESISIRLRGPLDSEAMISSIRALVRRHEALRGTFSPDGTSVCIAATLDVSVPVLDLSDLPPEEAEKRFQEIVREDALRPFDLVHGPLFRAIIVKTGQEEHTVVLTAHHAVCDGWSVDVLLKDLSLLYSAARRGEDPGLGQPHQFGAYALLMRQEIQGPEFAAAEAYWLKQFAEEVPALDLPVDFPRPKMRSYEGAREDRQTDPELLADLRKVGTRLGCSLFTVLLAGYKILLHRLSRQTDIAVGIPSAGQPVAGQNDLVGHCVSFLPLRSRFDGRQRFSEFVRAVSSTLLGAFENQIYSYGRLLTKLPVRRDPGRIPLVSATFTHSQSYEKGQLRFEGLEHEYFPNPRRFETFELNMNAREAGGRLEMICHYNTNLFRAGTIQRRLREYEVLLRGIAANPDAPIGLLPILTDEEERLLVRDWNSPVKEYPVPKCLHELFSEQAAKTPSSIALVFGDRRLTYAELDSRANQLAHCLRERGVGPEALVGLCIERSPEMVIAILGVLKAGGAYVPLDPAYPEERLAFMIEDSGIRALVAQKSICPPRLLERPALNCVLLDAEQPAIGRQSREAPRGAVTPDNPAYVIYTSGSTGRPKGVVVTHRNVTRLMAATEEFYHFDAADVWTLFHSYAFDFSVWEIWGALLYGGRLVIVPQHVARSPEVFLEMLAREKVTVLNQTPSAFRELIAAEEERPGRERLSLRYVIFGGEALDPAMPAPWVRRHGDESPQLVNMYGITETTVHATYRRLFREDAERRPGSVIGVRIPDLTLYVLDENLRPVPIGVAGEICVGGAGVARGYLNRDSLTAERFISNPFGPGRLYRSGDLARYLPDGSLEFLGRRDFQVKIRGFRIELNEIEAALRQYPQVRECVVLLREDVPDEKRLVAYLIPAAGPSINPSDLREFLAGKLPYYMAPSAFVFLEAFPLTPNGKLDRKALPPPGDLRPQLAGECVPPGTELEKTVAAIWGKLLGLKSVGIHDNFFDLGGHSLLLARGHAELRKATGLEVSILDMFQHPTIHAIARHLTHGKACTAAAEAAAERAQKHKDALARHKTERDKRRKTDD